MEETPNTTEQVGEHAMVDTTQPEGSAATPASPAATSSAAPVEPPPTLHDQPQDMNFPQNADRSTKPDPYGRSLSPKTPQQGAPAPPITQPVHATDPAVQNAGRFYSIAEALAGGQHYKYEPNVLTGEMKRTPVRLSKGQIGMAIVLEALTGSLAGLAGGRGKGAGAAGMAGMAQGQKLVQAQRDREQEQLGQEQQNMGRHYQVAEANMRMLSLAQTVGRMDEEMHNNLVTRGAPLIDYIRQQYPELMAQEFASEADAKDIKKFPLTEYTRIPQGTVPRLDSNGNQVWLDPYGKPVPDGTSGAHRALDNTYAIVRSGAKVAAADEKGATDLVKEAVKAGLLPESWMKASPGSEIPASMAANLSHKISALDAAADDLQSYYSHLNGTRVLDANASDTDASASTSLPPVKDEKIASLIDSAASKYGVSPAVLRALILTESGNAKTGEVNPKAVSPKGAKGLGQLMPGTAKQLGVSNPFDPEQNINGTAKYLRDLLASKGDLAKALSAYHGVGSDGITTDSEYSQKIIKLAGIGGGSNAAPKYAPTDVWAEVKKDPSLANALDKFQGVLNQTGSREAAIGKLAERDPRAAAKIARLYGGRDALHEADLQQKLHEQRLTADVAIDKMEQEGRNKQRLDNESAEYLQKFLDVPQGFNFAPELKEMKPQELQQELAKQGVDVPKNFASLYLAGHYRAPISSFAPRVWNKGSKFEMDQQTAESYIQQFINPDFDATLYGPKQKLRNELVSAQSRDGGSIRNASTAVQHLAMLKQASDALHNRNMPVFNHIANWFGVQVKGDPKPTDFKAIAEKVNAEVEKVAMGGNQPYVGQLEEGAKNMSRDFGPDTIDSVIGDYTRLMYGRMKSIDDNSFAELQEHLHNVSPEVTDLFKHYGMETPWQAQQQQRPLTNVGVNQQTGQQIGWDGHQWVDAKTRQPYAH